jgi:hypothetical protein
MLASGGSRHVCFSAEASFAVGAPLIPAGIYCLWSAAVKQPRYLGLAAVPVFFGIQQISEGFVWHALNHDDTTAVRAPSLFFLFFALAFWPFWFPFLAALMETSWRRWLFGALALLATIWFWVLYFPLLVSENAFTTQVMHHSIRYDYYDSLAVYQYVPRPLLQALYFASIALPMVLSSQSFGRIPGLVLGASAVLAAIVYDYAFVSVWCFFAAVLSIYCCVIFYRLPQADPPHDNS